MLDRVNVSPKMAWNGLRGGIIRHALRIDIYLELMLEFSSDAEITRHDLKRLRERKFISRKNVAM